MVKILFHNSYSQILDLKTEHFNALKKLLSYTPDGQSSFMTGRHPTRKYLIDKAGRFPSGLLSRVLAFLDKRKLAYDLKDTRTVATQAVSVSGKWSQKPYPAQVEAVNRAVEAGSGCISMPTGTGKSRVLAMLVQQYKVRTLIIVPSLEIKTQLMADLKEVFGNTKHIVVENIDSTKLKKDGKFGLLLIDEAHHVAANSYQKLNKTMWNDIPHRFFLTATPFRNNPEETLLFEAIAGDLVYQLTYKEAIKAGYIVPVEAYYYTLPMRQVDGNSWAQVFKELVVDYDDRNMLIAELAVQLNAMQKATLILVKEVKHGQALADITGFSFANGKDDDSREHIRHFNNGDIKILIGTEGILSEGVDTKPCEYVVVTALGKAKSSFMQKVGRAVRRFGDKESAKVVIFRDRSHKFTERHFKAQVKILNDEYGVVPVELER